MKKVSFSRACVLFLIMQSNLFFSFRASAADWVEFPKDFLWCVSTAAHQIEGDNFGSDWWEWEQRPGNSPSGKACDHWHRVKEDTQLIQQVGAKAYRFSIEWARIEPSEGVIDSAAVAHYQEEVELLEQAGIIPIITLQHFTFPLWVSQKGGWEWDGLPDAFQRYTALVAEQIAPHTQYWVTINEPFNYVLGAYYTGEVPPGVKGPIQGIAPALRGILRTHAAAYSTLHRLGAAHQTPTQVGMALQLREMTAKTWWNPLDQLAAKMAYSHFNWTLPDAMTSGNFRMNIPSQIWASETIPGLADTQDFVGMNYYGGDTIAFSAAQGMERLGWPGPEEKDPDAVPRGFYKLVKAVTKRYPGKPILILENGTMDSDDRGRVSLLKNHLKYLNQAMREGAPVRSYCHWTLYDSIEWNQGQGTRMGLFETDYETFERIPRASALFFRQIASENGFQF